MIAKGSALKRIGWLLKSIFLSIRQYAQGGIPYFAQLICRLGPVFPIRQVRWELSRWEGRISSFLYMMGVT